MRTLLRDLVDAYRRSARAVKESDLWRRYFDAPQTKDELENRVRDGRAAMAVIDTDGYRIWQAWQRTAIDEDIKQLLEMEPAEFQSARGLQQKGLIVGQQKALNGFAMIVKNGLIAEDKLREVETKIEQEQKKSPVTRL